MDLLGDPGLGYSQKPQKRSPPPCSSPLTPTPQKTPLEQLRAPAPIPEGAGERFPAGEKGQQAGTGGRGPLGLRLWQVRSLDPEAGRSRKTQRCQEELVWGPTPAPPYGLGSPHQQTATSQVPGANSLRVYQHTYSSD